MYTVLSYRITIESSGICYFALQLSNGRYTNLKPSSLETTSLYLDLLRNEKPVFYDERTQRLWTGEEPTGEGDASPK